MTIPSMGEWPNLVRIKIMNLSIQRFPRTRRFVLLALFTISLKGDEEDHALELNTLGAIDTVGPLIVEALKNNPGLVAHDKRYQAARQSIDAAGALPNPRAQITHFIESVQTRTGPQRQAIMLQQPIPWLGKLSSKRAAARHQANALWHAYAFQQFKLIDDVSQQVLEIAFLDKAIATTQQKITLLKRLETIVEDKVKAGGNLRDLLKLHVEIEQLEDHVAQQDTQRIVARSTLESLLGRTGTGSPIALQWHAPPALRTPTEQWLAGITERSPRIATLRALERSYESRERLSRLAARPDFSVGLNYIRTGDALEPTTFGSGQDPWALMVGISLPLWGKANHSVALQASLEKDAITAQTHETELILQAEGRAWIAKLENAQQRVERYASTLLPLARQSQEITKSGYQSGTASILDLIDSDRQLLKLEIEYWRAAADAWTARWKLATLSGGLWID